MRSNNRFSLQCLGKGDLLESTQIALSSRFEIQFKNCSDSLEKQTKAWFESYFDGSPLPIYPPLYLEGTPFQQSTWRLLQQIPFGAVKTYAQVAEEANAPRGSRAVGNACGKNRFILLIPCHRVIRSDGSIGGFAIDLEIKRRLLAFETQL